MNVLRALRATLSGNFKGHFGQYAEDTLVRKHFNPRRETGVCLDLGAYHPFRFNNTAYFWMCGWRCVNVDANAATIKLFNKYRSDDVNIHSAIVTQAEIVGGQREIDLLLPKKLDRHGISALGTSIPSQAPAEHQSIKVPCMSVRQILEENDLLDVSYINIDIEGYDEAVLLDIDLNRYRPKVITIEEFAEDVCAVVDGVVSRYMREHAYIFHSRAGYSSIYVKRN
jgi:FkbM family methyltransferase